jgi:hypothetical protein
MSCSSAASSSRLVAERDALLLDGAPPRVLAAADAAIRLHNAGLTPPRHLGDILWAHAHRRQSQNRWGK